MNLSYVSIWKKNKGKEIRLHKTIFCFFLKFALKLYLKNHYKLNGNNEYYFFLNFFLFKLNGYKTNFTTQGYQLCVLHILYYIMYDHCLKIPQKMNVKLLFFRYIRFTYISCCPSRQILIYCNLPFHEQIQKLAKLMPHFLIHFSEIKFFSIRFHA